MSSSLATETSSRAVGGVDWRRRYAARVAGTDLIALIWVAFGVQIAWLGLDRDALGSPVENNIEISYTAISIAIVVGWMSALQVYESRSDRVIGVGSAEYKMILDASVRLFGVVAIAAFLLKIDLARGYILIAFPLGTLTLLFSRWMWRKWLEVERQKGRYCSRVVLVGSEASAAHIAHELAKQSAAGYLVVGACIPKGVSGQLLSDTSIPVLGSMDAAVDALSATGADTVIITSADDLPPKRVRELSWTLVPGRQHLVVAPSLTDIGGPRIHTRPVSGLPLIHVETPQYEGSKLYTKRGFDVLVSGMLLLLLLPMLLVVALIVKVTSEGPVLYKQQRVGLNGRPFDMLKFRSMSLDADSALSALLAAQGDGDRPLFKVKNDPRVTRVGRILRKYSLDEFPQLINVLRGDMSLVGPRPQRDGEVALYDSSERRRLLLKPGMSGLWQVSGRSSLSWEDSVRLDLYYVENWSLTGDLIILWRTFKAIFSPGQDAH